MSEMMRRGLSLGEIACPAHCSTSLIPWKQLTKTEGASDRIYLCCPKCPYAVRIVAKTVEFGEYMGGEKRHIAPTLMQRIRAWLRRIWPSRQ